MCKQTITVIVPCYRSEAYVERTVDEIRRALDEHGGFDARLVLINDASPDGTFLVLQRLAHQHPDSVVAIDLASNVGQSRAKMAGLAYAQGPTVFMDDDGQHDPRSIPVMVEKIDEGFDAVYAAFPTLKEPPLRQAASKVLDCLLALFIRKPLDLRITSFFCLSPAAVKELQGYTSLHPFIGGYLMGRRMRVTSAPSTHRARRMEGSRYSLVKLVHRAVEMCWLYRVPRKEGDPPVFEVREIV